MSAHTHTIAMEKNRMLLLRTVQQFLEEPAPVPTATQYALAAGSPICLSHGAGSKEHQHEEDSKSLISVFSPPRQRAPEGVEQPRKNPTKYQR